MRHICIDNWYMTIRILNKNFLPFKIKLFPNKHALQSSKTLHGVFKLSDFEFLVYLDLYIHFTVLFLLFRYRSRSTNVSIVYSTVCTE